MSEQPRMNKSHTTRLDRVPSDHGERDSPVRHPAHSATDDPATPFLSDLVTGDARIDTPNGMAYGDIKDETDKFWRMFGGYGPHSFTRRPDGKDWDGNRSGE